MEPASTRGFGDQVAAIGLVLVVALLGAIAAIGIVVATDTNGSGDAQGGDWNTIVTVAVEDGEVTVHDQNGEQLDRIRTDLDFALATRLTVSTLVLTGDRDDRSAIELVDIASGRSTDLTREISSEDARFLRAQPVPGVDLVAIGSDAVQGSLYLVTPTGDVVDVAARARWDNLIISPFGVRATGDGRAVAVSGFGRDRTETAIVSLDSLDVEVVDGSLVATSDEAILTQGPIEDDVVEVRVFDIDGTETDRLDVDPFVVAMTDEEGRLITLGPDGDISRWSSGDAESLASVRLDTDQLPRAITTPGEQRVLAVVDDGDIVIVTADGTVLDDIDLDEPIEDVLGGDRCLLVSGESSIALVDTQTGDVIAEERRNGDRFVDTAASSIDSCTVVVLDGAELVLLGPDVSRRFDLDDGFSGLSPDGGSYARRRSRSGIEILSVDRTADPVEIDENPVRVFFLQR